MNLGMDLGENLGANLSANLSANLGVNLDANLGVNLFGGILSSYNLLTLLMLVSIALFCVGVFGIMAGSGSLIKVVISVELIMLAANINFAVCSVVYGNADGVAYTIFALAISAAELAVGLAVILIYFQANNTENTSSANQLSDKTLPWKLDIPNPSFAEGCKSDI